jgi:plastocyanin
VSEPRKGVLLRTTAALILVSLVAVSGCKKEKELGNESLLDFKEKEQQRLGQASPTPTSAQQAAPAPQGKQGVGQAAPQPQQPAEQPAIKVAINSDTAGSAFDPSVVRVSKGAKVTWTNQSEAERSVVADDRTFNSGPIPPGGTYSWTANKVGKIGYTDGTRPYAVGSIEVV